MSYKKLSRIISRRRKSRNPSRRRKSRNPSRIRIKIGGDDTSEPIIVTPKPVTETGLLPSENRSVLTPTANSIINYTYILENSDGSLITEDEYSDIYNKIILNYHYPICLNVTVELNEEEKNAIKRDEYTFILDKLPNTVKMYKIPRILYDMFIVLYVKVVNYNNPFDIYKFDDKSSNYLQYCQKANKLHQIVLKKVYELNNYIIQYLRTKNIHYKDATYLDYVKMLNSIIMELNNFIDNVYPNLKLNFYRENKGKIIESFMEESDELVKNIFRVKPTINYASIAPIVNHLGYNFKKDKEYIRHIFYCLFTRLSTKINDSINRNIKFGKLDENGKDEIIDLVLNTLNNDEEMSDIILTFKRDFSRHDELLAFVKTMNAKLLTKILIDETMSSLNNPSKFILYRGATDTLESPIDNADEDKGYSISYNTSTLNGVLSDYTACTYMYMNNASNFSIDNIQRKHEYVIKRFFYGDNTVSDNLFFIPPFHPYLQMSTSGEFWHARSKIFTGSKIDDVAQFAGSYRSITGIVGDKNSPFQFPDFLTSKYNKTEIKFNFKKFIDMHRNEVQDKEENEHAESTLFGGLSRTRKNKMKRKKVSKVRK
jgi:hypothetical protein